MSSELIYLISSIIVCIVFVFIFLTDDFVLRFKQNIVSFITNLNLYKIYKTIPKQLRIIIQSTIIEFILEAEKIYAGYCKDEDGTRRHFYVKQSILGILRVLKLEDKISEEDIDELIKQYVKKLKLNKDKNPFK